MLFERQEPLDRLRKAQKLAEKEAGRTILISGEAGIGKTSLIDAFATSLPADVPVFRGGCEALFVARPLGPLFDIADQMGGTLRDMLQGDVDNHRIYSEFLAMVERNDFAGAVFVLEDIHWADNATMDFLKFIGRRIDQSRCLLVASYRDDEIGPNHPLRYVIGDLPSNLTSRIVLTPLSLASVIELCCSDKKRAKEILDVSAGNPFFVQELLSSTASGIPA